MNREGILMTTINEVARLAGVSGATVSRVLNHDKSLSVPESTRAKVFAAAEKLQYKPQKNYKSKQNQNKQSTSLNSYRIGILLWYSQEEGYSEPYFLSIRRGVEKRCEELGIVNLEILRMTGNKNEDRLMNLDGIIAIGKINFIDMEKVFPVNAKVVFVDYVPDIHKFDSIISNFEEGTQKALQHLMRLEHREISFIGGREFVSKFGNSEREEIEDLRFKAFESFMKQEGLYNADQVYVGDWSINSGYEIMANLIKLKKVARSFFIANDSLAIGAIKALHENGYRVPEDVAIVSFDDIGMARYVTPALTTIRVHTEQIGKAALDLLVSRIEGREIPLQITFPTELIVRESCGTELSKSR